MALCWCWDTIHIQGTVTDDKSLHEMSVVLVKGTSDTVYAEYPYVHDLKTYPFQYYFHPTASGTYTLHVNATDHDEAKSEKIVSVVVM